MTAFAESILNLFLRNHPANTSTANNNDDSSDDYDDVDDLELSRRKSIRRKSTRDLRACIANVHDMWSGASFALHCRLTDAALWIHQSSLQESAPLS